MFYSLFLLIVMFAMLPQAAFAATITVDTGAIIDALGEPILGLVSALAFGFAAWIAETLRRKFNLDIEARHREAFQTALVNGAGHFIASLKARHGEPLTYEVKSELLAGAANMVIRSVPDAIKKFGLTREMVEQKIIDKLPVVAPVQPPAEAVDLEPAKPAGT